VVRLDAGRPDLMTVLTVIADMLRAAPKILVAVYEDIDPDADAVQWAMSYRMQPRRDIQIRDIKALRR
jgi:UbiD family decarboxylase